MKCKIEHLLAKVITTLLNMKKDIIIDYFNFALYFPTDAIFDFMT